MKHLLLIFALLGGHGANAAAVLTCTFTTECYESEACSETNFELTVSPNDEYSEAQISSLSGDFNAKAWNFQAMSTFTGFTSGTLHMISVFKARQARYSVHSGSGDDLLMINYTGTCE